MRRWLLAVSLCMFTSVAISANVAWDSLVLSYDGAYDGVQYYSIVYPYLSFSGTASGAVLTLRADANDYMEIASMWSLANKGEVASVESIVDKWAYFYAADFAVGEGSGVVKTDYPISIEEGSSVYLEMICKTYSRPEDVAVGWIELAYGNGELSIVHSAIDQDGAPLIVGAGGIPEPNGGLLFLIGLAALLMQRPRGNWILNSNITPSNLRHTDKWRMS